MNDNVEESDEETENNDEMTDINWFYNDIIVFNDSLNCFKNNFDENKMITNDIIDGLSQTPSYHVVEALNELPRSLSFVSRSLFKNHTGSIIFLFTRIFILLVYKAK